VNKTIRQSYHFVLFLLGKARSLLWGIIYVTTLHFTEKETRVTNILKNRTFRIAHYVISLVVFILCLFLGYNPIILYSGFAIAVLSFYFNLIPEALSRRFKEEKNIFGPLKIMFGYVLGYGGAFLALFILVLLTSGFGW